jgi:hypothetical protein
MIFALAGKENHYAKLNAKDKSKDVTPTPHLIKEETPHDPKSTNQGDLKIQKTQQVVVTKKISNSPSCKHQDKTEND